jgi:signal transduction histidine kinase
MDQKLVWQLISTNDMERPLSSPSLPRQARSIAHDMANDLACIILEFSLLEQDVANIPTVQKNIQQIRAATERLSEKMRALSQACRAMSEE